MVSFGGDMIHPRYERQRDRSLTRGGSSRSRADGLFWRRDQLENEPGTYTSDQRGGEDGENTMQVDKVNPPAEPREILEAPKQSRSASASVFSERPRVHIRQASYGPSLSTAVTTSSRSIGSLDPHSEFTRDAPSKNSHFDAASPAADPQSNAKTLDPRLKQRINNAAAMQNNAQSPTMLSDNSLSQPRLIERLIDIKLRERKNVDDHHKAAKYIAELEGEHDQAVKQFGDSNSYTMQLFKRIASTRSKASDLQQKLEDLGKEEESCRRAFSASQGSSSDDTELQRMKEGLSRQEQKNIVKDKEIKELKVQVERLMSRMDTAPDQPAAALNHQNDALNHSVKMLEKKLAEVEAAAESSKLSTNKVKAQMVEVKHNMKQIQETELDPVKVDVKSQKLAIARLNDVFASKNSFDNLKQALDELRTKPVLGSTDLKNYVSHDDLNNYVQKLTGLEVQTETRFHDLEAQNFVRSGQLESYAESHAVKELAQRLAALQQSQDGLMKHVNAMQSMSPETMRRLHELESRIAVVSNDIGALNHKMDGITARLQAFEVRAKVSETSAASGSLSVDEKRTLQQMPNLRHEVTSVQQRLQSLDNVLQNNSHSITSLSERFNKLKTDELARRITGRLEPMLSTIKPQLSNLHARDQDIRGHLERTNALYNMMIETVGKVKLSTTEALNASSTTTEKMNDFGKRTIEIEQKVNKVIEMAAVHDGVQNELKKFQSSVVQQLKTIDEVTTQSREELQQESDAFHEVTNKIKDELSILRDEYQDALDMMKKEFQIEQQKLVDQFIEARDTFNAQLDEMKTDFHEKQEQRLPIMTRSHDLSPVPAPGSASSSTSTGMTKNVVTSSTVQTTLDTTGKISAKVPRTDARLQADRHGLYETPQESSKSPMPNVLSIERCFIPHQNRNPRKTPNATPGSGQKVGKRLRLPQSIIIPDSDEEIPATESNRSDVDTTTQSSDQDVPEVNMDDWVGRVPSTTFQSINQATKPKKRNLQDIPVMAKTPDQVKLKRKRESPLVMRDKQGTESGSQSTPQAKIHSMKKKKTKS